MSNSSESEPLDWWRKSNIKEQLVKSVSEAHQAARAAQLALEDAFKSMEQLDAPDATAMLKRACEQAAEASAAYMRSVDQLKAFVDVETQGQSPETGDGDCESEISPIASPPWRPPAHQSSRIDVT